jgi:aspartyl/asparaginyl beta-hydroxylase (cupin superfamily)
MDAQANLFPFLPRLEENWQGVKEELDNILYNEVELDKSYFTPWPDTEIYEGSLDTYPLYVSGEPLKSNCKYCPNTVKVLKKIPGLVNARFSALAPNTLIKPHGGQNTDLWRCDLALVVPPSPPADTSGNYWLRTGILPQDMLPVCGMSIEGDVLEWTPGKAFVFDDTVQREAWNYGNRTRFILLVQFKK